MTSTIANVSKGVDGLTALHPPEALLSQRGWCPGFPVRQPVIQTLGRGESSCLCQNQLASLRSLWELLFNQLASRRLCASALKSRSIIKTVIRTTRWVRSLFVVFGYS